MNKRDYILVANAIQSMPTFAPSLRTAQLSAATVLRDAFAYENPSFDALKFMNDCLTPH